MSATGWWRLRAGLLAALVVGLAGLLWLRAPRSAGRRHAATVIDAAIDVIRRERGSGCGTPALEARHSIVRLGAAAVPALVSRVESERFADVHAELGDCVEAITCRPRAPSWVEAQPFDVEAFKAWWREHGDESRDEWILATWERDDGWGSSCELELSDPRIVRRLEGLLASGTRRQSRGAMRVLWTRLRSPAVLAHARTTMATGDRDARWEMLGDIGDLKLAEMAPEILAALRTESDVTEAAAHVASRLGIREAVPLILEREREADDLLRCGLLGNLLALSAPDLEPRVRGALRARDETHRACVVQILLGSREPWAHALLMSALDDPSPRVVSVAASALGSLQGLDEAQCRESARKLLPRARPAAQWIVTDPAPFIDDALWRLAVASGAPADLVPPQGRFTEAHVAALRDWWSAYLREPAAP